MVLPTPLLSVAGGAWPVVPSPPLSVEGGASLALPTPLPTVGGGGGGMLSAPPTLPPLVLCPFGGGKTRGVAPESCDLREQTRI